MFLMTLLYSCTGGGDSLTPKEITKDFDLTLMPFQYVSGSWYKGGFVKPDGEIVVEYQSRYANNCLCYLFHDGLAYVLTDDERGFVNERGELVIDLTDFERPMSAHYFSEGLYICYDKVSNTTVALDKKGDRVWEIEGTPITQLLGGYAMLGNGHSRISAIINSKGEIVFEPDDDEYIPAIAGYGTPAQYAHPSIFPVCNGNGVSYLIDVASGERILENALPELRDANVAVDGNNQVVLHTDDGYGIMDLNGNWVVEPQYDYICNDGKWYVYSENNECGWLDSNGEIVIPAQFKFYTISNIPLFGASDLCNVDQHTFINRKGEVALETDYFIQSNFIRGKALASDRKSYFWIDESGEQLGEPMLVSEGVIKHITELSRGTAIQYFGL